MKAGHHSRTADLAAAARARHYLRDPRPLVFEDRFALGLTSAGERRILENRFLDWILYEFVFRTVARPLRAQVVGRGRFAEEALGRALGAGVRQYVIIGAGMDSFALRRRDLESTLRVIEIDHPDTQRIKRNRLDALGVSLPTNLEFLSADLAIEPVGAVLRRSGFDPGIPVLYSWLGTTMYLDHSSTLATLRSITECSCPGSEVVFDYCLPEHLLLAHDVRTLRVWKRTAARRGEPLKGEFSPEQLAREVQGLGFEVLEDLSAKEQSARYFGTRADALHPSEMSHFTHLRYRQRDASS